MSLKLLFFLLIVYFMNQSRSDGYRILGIFPINVHSHMVFFERLMKGLAKRGHQVDVVSTFPQRKPIPNYTDIEIPPAMPKLVNNMSYEFFEDIKRTSMVHFLATTVGNFVCEKAFDTPEILRLVNNPPDDPPYDIVVTEIFSSHCFIAFGRHLKVPVIGMCSAALYPWMNDIVANPANLAIIPNNLLGYKEKMDFWERLYNAAHTFYSKNRFDTYIAPQTALIRKHFGPEMPEITELVKDLALLMANSHFAINGIKPTTPALLELGGLHIDEDISDIPLDDKNWMDESENGFIYFSFGSMVVIESFPKAILDIFYKSLAKISPVRIFMKVPHPEKLPPGLPNNIRTFTWMPQLKVLKHKNIRAFVTHGGLMGTQEAIYCGVPLIGVPLFADQFVNIDLYVRKRIAVRLDYIGLTEAKVDYALNEVLNNPIYRDAVRNISHIFLDRPLNQLDEAIYWTEYIIRHGSMVLRSPSLDLQWWQIELLDIYVTFLTFIIVIIFITLLAIKVIFNYFIVNSRQMIHAKKIN